MPTPIPIPLINGTHHDYGAIEFKLDGLVYIGVSEIAYKHMIENELVYGTAMIPIGQTAGQYKPDRITATFVLSYLESFRAALHAKAAGQGYGSVVFNGTCSYAAAGDTPIVDEFIGCRLLEEDLGHSSGPGALTEKVSIQPTFIKRNGKQIYKTLAGVAA